MSFREELHWLFQNLNQSEDSFSKIKQVLNLNKIFTLVIASLILLVLKQPLEDFPHNLFDICLVIPGFLLLYWLLKQGILFYYRRMQPNVYRGYILYKKHGFIIKNEILDLINEGFEDFNEAMKIKINELTENE